MYISNEDFIDEFTTFGVKVDDEDVFDMLRGYCQQYRLDASDISMEWIAFSHTNKQCKLKPETLEKFEHDRLSKKLGKMAKTPKASKDEKIKIPKYDAPQYDADAGGAGDFMDAYATPKGKNVNKRQHTPDQHPQNKRLTSLAPSPAVTAPFSPGSLSPADSMTPSKKYASRNNQGEVVLSFGNSKNVTWKSNRQDVCPVKQFDKETSLTGKFKYMFQKLSDKAIILNDQIENATVKLQEHHKITEQMGNIALPSQDVMTVSGRVGCDSHGKLNARSVELQGSQDCGGRSVALDISDVKQYSLFPGQVVMMDAVNPTGTKLVAKKMYEGVAPPQDPQRENVPSEDVRFMIACGPFTTADNVMYEPLADLMTRVRSETPDVCILIGPFVDIKNPEVEKLTASYEEFFKRTITQISEAFKKLQVPTQLLILPSQRDIHHDNVYPQPPFSVPGLDNPRVHFLPDPCMVRIDGVVMALTSTDILFHLGLEEISHPPGASDRLARLAQHILHQGNFYPLYPPADEVNIDYDHFDVFAKIPVKPDVLVIPSDLRYFIKDVSGTLAVNPGRLTKGQVGGTYVRMKVSRPSSGSLVTSTVGDVLRI